MSHKVGMRYVYTRKRQLDGLPLGHVPSVTPSEKVFRKQGLLYGRLSSLGFDSKLRAMAENLTYDVVYSSEIEGIRLNVDQVRSSIARKLGIENVKDTAPSHYVDSVVGVMLEAVQHYDMTLSKEKLCALSNPLSFQQAIVMEVR